MDYGKFKFDAAQRAKESRRKAVHVGIKEMKYRPKIGDGDFDTKTRQVAKFLEEGHKVKITIMFRGREVFHPELGKKILDRIADQMDGMGKSESVPRLDGRNMVMVLAPDKRAKQSAASREPGHNGNGSGAKAGAAPTGAVQAQAAAGTSSPPAAAEAAPTAAPTAAPVAAAEPTAAPTAAPEAAVEPAEGGDPPTAAPAQEAGDASPAHESSEGEG
jgi:translation initiation factor IF-3